MKLHLTPETEAKLDALRQQTGRDAAELVAEAVDHLVSYNEWLEFKVKESQAKVANGEAVPDEVVRDWIESRER